MPPPPKYKVARRDYTATLNRIHEINHMAGEAADAGSLLYYTMGAGFK